VTRKLLLVALLLAALACVAMAAVSISTLVDQPWKDADEPLFADGVYVAIFLGLGLVPISAALAIVTVIVRRMRAP